MGREEREGEREEPNRDFEQNPLDKIPRLQGNWVHPKFLLFFFFFFFFFLHPFYVCIQILWNSFYCPIFTHMLIVLFLPARNLPSGGNCQKLVRNKFSCNWAPKPWQIKITNLFWWCEPSQERAQGHTLFSGFQIPKRIKKMTVVSFGRWKIWIQHKKKCENQFPSKSLLQKRIVETFFCVEFKFFISQKRQQSFF